MIRIIICLGATIIALPSSVLESKPIKLIASHDAYTKILPSSDDKFLDEIKSNPNIIWYDRESIPDICQHWRPADISDTPGFQFGLFSTHTNISAEKTEPFGNPNREFPWLTTAGIEVKTPIANFAIIPKTVEVKWIKTTAKGYSKNWDLIEWTYPVGTVFGEVIFVSDDNSNKYPCEVRIRKKGEKGWSATAYRPFPTSDDLRDGCLDIDREDREIIINSLDKPKTKIASFKNDHPDLTVIDEKTTLEFLPKIKPESVRKLLNRKFKNALGAEWRKANPTTHAPTTESDFHIVPKNYMASAVEVSTKSCNRCHDSIGKEASDFTRGREWYGHVRGSDTIFSFHPFDPKIAKAHNFNDKTKLFRNDELSKLFDIK